jgi:hypothetical protein
LRWAASASPACGEGPPNGRSLDLVMLLCAPA